MWSRSTVLTAPTMRAVLLVAATCLFDRGSAQETPSASTPPPSSCTCSCLASGTVSCDSIETACGQGRVVSVRIEASCTILADTIPGPLMVNGSGTLTLPNTHSIEGVYRRVPPFPCQPPLSFPSLPFGETSICRTFLADLFVHPAQLARM